MPRSLLAWTLLVALLFAPARVGAALPAGFVSTSIGAGWFEPVGMTFDENGRGYVWERRGTVWIVDGTTRLPVPLLDIHDEIANYGDFGLLGFALHPDFLSNGWFYVLYGVDHHHLEFAGTPQYDPNADDYNRATIVRLTRYTATAASGRTAIDPTSRFVILGETASSGCPLVYQNHGPGALVFGQDGTLLASCGDGATAAAVDTGGNVGGAYATQALNEGIITATENVGAYRSQLINSLSGKILRLDPETGDGVPSNPYYDAANPRAPRSRVWVLGLRNPFRFVLRPDTGSHAPEVGDPGTLYIGDVGYDSWEDVDVASGPRHNYGWPIFDGMDTHWAYSTAPVENRDAPNPLAGGACGPFFRFIDLLRQETLDPNPSFPNPCNTGVQIPVSSPRFLHRRPDFTYPHNPVNPTLVRTFSGLDPATITVGPASSVPGPANFFGFSSTGGVWYRGSDFPVEWQDSYYHADYATGWVLRMRFDANEQPTSLDYFWPDAGAIVSLATSPTTGGLYVVDINTHTVRRVAWAPGGNQPPTAQASATPSFGPSPLSVQLSSAGSSDPEGLPLSYRWTFSDGTSPVLAPSTTHVFTQPGGTPTTFTATLTVTDSATQTASVEVPVYVNNTPPQVTITSPVNQSLYSPSTQSNRLLGATLSDLEHGAGALACTWRQFLHHNTHQHPEGLFETCSATAVLSPIGCDGNTYYYRFNLTVTDPLGLATTREVQLYPDCASLFPVVCGDIDGSGVRNSADVSALRAAFANPTGSGLSAPALARCSSIGAAECDVADLSVLRRYLAALAPGPLPVCPAAP